MYTHVALVIVSPTYIYINTAKHGAANIRFGVSMNRVGGMNGGEIRMECGKSKPVVIVIS